MLLVNKSWKAKVNSSLAVCYLCYHGQQFPVSPYIKKSTFTVKLVASFCPYSLLFNTLILVEKMYFNFQPVGFTKLKLLLSFSGM